MAITAEEREQLDAMREQDNTAADTISRMSVHDPDRAAETIDLMDATGLPQQVVEDDLTEARRRKQLKLMDLDGLKDRSPGVAAFVSNENDAARSHDDLDNLEQYERLVADSTVSFGDVAATLPAGAIEAAGLSVSGLGHAYDAYSRSVNRLFNTEGLNKWVNELVDPEPGGAALTINEWFNKLTDFGGSLKYTGGHITGVAQSIDLTPAERESLSYWQNVGVDISKGTGQMAGQILTYWFGGLTASAVQLTGQGVGQAAERQIASGTLGKDTRSDAGLMMGGVITVVTEKISLDQMINRIPWEVKGRIFKNLTDIVTAFGVEALQEVVEGVLHGYNEIVTSNPDVNVWEDWEREALAGGGSAAVMRTIIGMMGVGGRRRRGQIDPTYNAMMKEAHIRLGSEQGQFVLDKRISFAQESKTNKRSPEAYENFIEGIDPEEYVYIRPEALIDYVGVPDYIAEQIDGTGANVAVPMKKFLSEIVHDEALMERIRPHIILREDHQTEIEMTQGPASHYVMGMMERAKQHQDAFTEAQEIYEQVKDQIVGTMRQGEDTARMSAQLLPAMIVTEQRNLAARGIEVSVRELYEKMGLKIVGPSPAFDERDVMMQDILAEDDSKVGYRSDRIDQLIWHYDTWDGFGTGFVVYIDPKKFIPASTADDDLRTIVGAETETLREDDLSLIEVPDDGSVRIEADGTRQVPGEPIETPLFWIEQNPDGSWYIKDHQGRHRMASMALAGYEKVPVILQLPGRLGVDPSSGGIVPIPEGELAGLSELTGQQDNLGQVGDTIELLTTPVAISQNNRQQLHDEIGVGQNPALLMQKAQDFGDITFEEEIDGHKVTEKAQKVWEFHQERLEMVEVLKKCLMKN